jgi:hypothetical protein
MGGAAPFRAYFTPDSPTEFSIFPTEGALEPEGEDGGGTPFLISYAPREYGKRLVGRLVILSDEMQWTYEVRGNHPHYTAPVAGEPKVDSRLSFEMASQLDHGAPLLPLAAPRCCGPRPAALAARSVHCTASQLQLDCFARARTHLAPRAAALCAADGACARADLRRPTSPQTTRRGGTT